MHLYQEKMLIQQSVDHYSCDWIEMALHNNIIKYSKAKSLVINDILQVEYEL